MFADTVLNGTDRVLFGVRASKHLMGFSRVGAERSPIFRGTCRVHTGYKEGTYRVHSGYREGT